MKEMRCTIIEKFTTDQLIGKKNPFKNMFKKNFR